MTMKRNKADCCSLAALRYARVLYELKIPEDIVLETGSILENEPELLEVLRSPVVTKEKKHILIERIFHKEIQNFLKVASDYGKISSMPEIARAYEKQKNRMSGILEASLKYVVMPEDEQLARMEEFIKDKYGAAGVRWEMHKDDTLIGGFILHVDGKEYDYSIEGRLKRLEQKLTRR